MKYIVDLPEAYTSESALFGDILSIPICLESGKRYGIPTGIKLEPYTEPDRKAIDLQYARDIENVARMNYNEGAKDAWEFAKKIGSFNGLTKHELDECFGHTTIQGVMTTYDTYQEAKDKYDAWKKQREEINIGDEISCPGKLYVEAVVIGMDDDDDLYIIWKQSGKIDMIESSQRKHWVKTGRCFLEVEELLKKMREESNED